MGTLCFKDLLADLEFCIVHFALFLNFAFSFASSVLAYSALGKHANTSLKRGN